MIAKAKSISHGINGIRYIMGESRNKKHPERIFHVKDNLLPPGLDAAGVWASMQLTLTGARQVKNSVIRIEVSPAPQHTEHFGIADWEKLWDDFIQEFDNIELLDRNGRTYSPKTNLRGSKGQVYLHLESQSGIPPPFTARSAASTGRDRSTTTMTSTCGRSVQPSAWP